MAKLLLTPVLSGLVLLATALVLFRRQRDRVDTRDRWGVRLAAGAFTLFTMAGSPACGRLLEMQLSAPYCGPVRSQPPSVDVAVVLSGGAVRRLQHAPPILNEESILRVRRGVELVRAGLASSLVMAGESEGRVGERDVDLLREFALQLGVAADRIDLEPNAVNTRQHPVALLQVRGITRQTRLAVVTSGWHLRRTMVEFRKHFSAATGVPAACPPALSARLEHWLPSASGLGWTATMSHEYIGRLWYALRDVWEP